jgi:hypothetical protein
MNTFLGQNKALKDLGLHAVEKRREEKRREEKRREEKRREEKRREEKSISCPCRKSNQPVARRYTD